MKERCSHPPPPRCRCVFPPKTDRERSRKSGWKRIADALDPPRAPLAARFGAGLCAASIRRSAARTSRIRARACRFPAAITEQRFAEPIALERDVLGTIEKLAARNSLRTARQRRGEGARLLQAALFRTDGKVFRIEVGLSELLREPARIRHLLPTGSA